LNFYYLALIGGVFIFFLILFLLIFFGKNRRYLNTVLSVAIGGIIWYIIIYLLTTTGYIQHFPSIFNKGLPLYYLIGPCFYLYMRGTIYPKYASFRKADLLHLLVTVPAICSIIPYSLLDQAGQQYVVDQIARDSNYGFSDAEYIVGTWHWLTWPLTALIYMVFQLVMIFKARHVLKSTEARWMTAITILCAIIFTALLGVNTFILLHKSSVFTFLTSNNIVLFFCCCFLILGAAFFTNPNFIYGGVTALRTSADEVPVTGEIPPIEQAKIVLNEPLPLKTQSDLALVSELESYLAHSKLYLETGLTLSKLAVAAGIPSYRLSELLNHHYQKNFNAYINIWRIRYIVARLDAGDHKSLTLEALANEAGFTSRNSFFTAFKRVMGLPPSAYVNNLKLKSA
jgi:AraC-like DNA-binding protein